MYIACASWAGNGDVHCVTQHGGACSAVTHGIIYNIYVYYIYIRMCATVQHGGHQRTVGIPAGGGQVGIPAGATPRMGMHAHAMGEGGH